MAGWDIMGNVKGSVDDYLGGAGVAVIAHYADQAGPVGFLANQNISNAEGILGSVIIGGALALNRTHGRMNRLFHSGIAAATYGLTDEALKGRFAGIGGGGGTTQPTSTVTGFDVINGDWGGDAGTGGPVATMDSNDASGFGLD